MQTIVSSLSFKGVIKGVIGKLLLCVRACHLGLQSLSLSLSLMDARAKVQRKFTNNDKMALKSRSICDINFDFGVSEQNCEYSKLYCQYWKENILSKIQIK